MRRVATYQGMRVSRQQILDKMAWYDQAYPSNDYREPPAGKGWRDNDAYKNWGLCRSSMGGAS